MRLQRWQTPLVIGAAAIGVVAAPTRADACTAPPILAAVYSPANGEINVPTNAVIDIHVFGDLIPPGIENQFSLWQNATPINTPLPQRVDSSVSYITSIRLTPCSFCLISGLTYQVRFGTTPSSQLLGSFTTGPADLSGAPPPLTGASATVSAFDTHPDGGSDCFTERIRQVRLSVPNVGKPVVYTLKEGNQVISADDVSLIGTFYCSGQPHWQGDTSWVISPGQHTVQLSAIDRAGNSSTTVDVSFNATCAGDSDGGTSDGGSGNGTLPGDTNTTVPVQTSSGCSCGTGVSAAIALAGFATILRARRRKPAR